MPQAAFLAAVNEFVQGSATPERFRRRLGVKGVKGATGIFEMTWAADGRATFDYGEPVRDDEPHVVWPRIGTHAIFTEP